MLRLVEWDPNIVAVYAVVSEAVDGWVGLLIEVPPSCEFLLSSSVLLPLDWFDHNDVTRLA